MFLKVIACEIAFREICHISALTPSLLDLEFLTQGYHDTPALGRAEIQKRIDAVPAGKYDAILLGYGLCSNIITALSCSHTPLVIPRAHDCIALFLGSKERYQKMFFERPGTYYYTSGWLECAQKRQAGRSPADERSVLSQAVSGMTSAYDQWVKKYGEEQAKYLMEVMKGWSDHYTHGVLIDFDFSKPLKLDDQVGEICTQRGWTLDTVEGDLGLLQRWVDGIWDPNDFLVVPPGRSVVATNDDTVIGLTPPS